MSNTLRSIFLGLLFLVLNFESQAIITTYRVRSYFLDASQNTGHPPDLNEFTARGLCTGDTIIINLLNFDGSTRSATPANTSITWYVKGYKPVNSVLEPYDLSSGSGYVITIPGNIDQSTTLLEFVADSAGENGFTVRSNQNIQYPTIIKSAILELGANIIACPGTSAAFANLSSTGVGSPEYRWSNGATTPSITVTSADLYVLTVNFTESGKTCSTIDAVRLNNHPKPEVNAGGSRFRCFGQSLELNAQIVTESTTPYSYKWTPEDGRINGVTTQKPIVSPIGGIDNGPATTIYTVVVTDNKSCKDTSSVTVIKNSPFKVALNVDDITLCKFISLPLPVTIVSTAPGTANYTYQWSPVTGLTNPAIANPSVSGVSVEGIHYVVTVTDSRACTATESITIKRSSLELSFVPASLEVISVCSGDLVSELKVTRKGGSPAYTFTWSPSDVLEKTTDTLYKTKAITQKQTIIAQVADGNGCTDKDTVTLYAKPLPVSGIAANDQNICVGSTKQISASPADGSGSYSFRWSPDLRINDITSSAPIFTAANSESSNPQANAQAYFVTITSTVTNCKAVDVLNISTKAATPVSIEKLFEKSFIDTALSFKALPDGLTYLWEISSITGTQNTQTITQTFSIPGDYTISLTGTNAFSCASLATLPLRVLQKSTNVLYVPTLFSPSASLAANRTFLVFAKTTSIVPNTFKVSVFNLYGQKVFESTDINTMCTDGLGNFEGLGWSAEGYPSGVYAWAVSCTFLDETVYKDAGSVTLVK